MTTDWQNDYIDNHHHNLWTRQYYTSRSAWDWDSEWYNQRPYNDRQDNDHCPNTFPSLDMPARNSWNLTPEAAQSNGDTATRGSSVVTKETPWGQELQRQSPQLHTRNHWSASCHQKTVHSKTVCSQLQGGQRRKRKNPATKMSQQGGWGGRQQKHHPLVTRQWKTHKPPISKMTWQTRILDSKTPPQLTATQSFMMPKSRFKIQRE